MNDTLLFPKYWGKCIAIIVLMTCTILPSAFGRSGKFRGFKLDADIYMDTIVTDSNSNLSRINWGGSPEDSIKNQTVFVYPTENSAKCRYSLIRFDQDTLRDIYINIKYTFSYPDSVLQISDSTYLPLDSTYHYIIFGQESLKNTDTVYINYDSVFPAGIAYYSGIDEIFSDISLCTPGSMKILTFKKVDRSEPVPIVQTTPVEDNIISNHQIEFYPIPSNDYVNYRLSGFENGIYDIEIYNLYNEQVYFQNIQVSGSVFTGYIALTNLASGIYSVRIKNSVANLNKLIMIVK